MKTALYIGRFQPFHKGHADALLQIFEQKDVKKLIIGIGSAEENFTSKNPLTAGERFKIIESALDELRISKENIWIVPIRDIHHYALWTYHAQQLLPFFDAVYSGSPLVQKLWKDFSQKEIRQLQIRKKISATQVRDLISCGGDLDEVLLPSTQTLCKEFGLHERLQKIGE